MELSARRALIDLHADRHRRGLCIFVFATGYMHGDTGFYRFFAYMGLFMFSMLVLVMGSNFLMMFVGWEGVGLCSYLLIGYYFDRQEAANASRKAFITNRIGDFGFALAIFGVIATFGTAQYTDVVAQASELSAGDAGTLGTHVVDCAGTFHRRLWQVGTTSVARLVAGRDGRSDAGLGADPRGDDGDRGSLHGDAHQRHLSAFANDDDGCGASIGAATAFFAATIGITQNDIKKVLAYSTVSQLGFMFMACGVGAFAIGIFHVMTHAFFKALMFLGAGSVIHGMHHEQDMRTHGRTEEVHALHLSDFLGRLVGNLRHHSVQRVLVQR